MGYCYGYNERGRLVLACDSCGNIGGVRKRLCPFKVDGLPYCYPAALCPPCYVKHKPTLHKDCKEGAAKMQVEEDRRRARRATGDFEVLAAWGDWHPDVPAGWVGVAFGGEPYRMGGPERWLLVPADEYKPGEKRFESDYPVNQPWVTSENRSTKEV